jgi:protein phosphatase
MQNASAMLYCPNPNCQASNLEENKFCHKCQTPLTHQYLWAASNVAHQPGDLLGDRFLYKGSRIFLDTKPGLLSTNSSELPAHYLPYLRLSPLRLHVPQVYEWLPTALPDKVLLLLDYCPIQSPFSGENVGLRSVPISVQLFPTLSEVWQEANPLRQLNWLWQMANLWQPLSSEGVVSSLLDPELLRAEGGILRLLELRLDSVTSATKGSTSLATLGKLWLKWAETARTEIAARIQQISQQLIRGDIHNAEQLTERIDEAIAQISQAHTRKIEIATLTDQGPTRQRNEDACYPASGTDTQNPDLPLVIVCDGIGGHQGGDVASNLAIEAIGQRVKVLKPDALDPVTLTVELEKAACVANDQISQRNDSEQRHDRQRMGTTLVMGLMRGHELYVTHVGDSRAYWITRWGCHQITLDDDVASREVRLGYSAYRQALQQPSSGSLVQALGMGTSNLLYPTVQRFIIDEDSVFLFCSDGLSDNDRVESCWDTEILPILQGQADLNTVVRRLVEIANTFNGYDNATVGILHCQMEASQPVPTLLVPLAEAPLGASLGATDTPTFRSESKSSDLISSSTLETQLVRQSSPKFNPLPLLLGIVVLIGLGTGLIVALLPALTQRAQLPPSSPANPKPTSSTPLPSALLSALNVGAQIQLRRPTAATSPSPAAIRLPMLLSSPPQPLESPVSPNPAEAIPQTLGAIPVGSVLEVLKVGGTTQQDRWVQLRVCSTPAGISPESSSVQSPGLDSSPQENGSQPEAKSEIQVYPSGASSASVVPTASPTPAVLQAPAASPAPFLQPGKIGWIREEDILPVVSLSQSSLQLQGVCANPATLGLPE